MSSNAVPKVFIQVESLAEQQHHLKTQRKTLKPIQAEATDKENFAGRPQVDKLSRLKAAVVSIDGVVAPPEYGKRKRVETTKAVETQTVAVATQTDEVVEKITVEDLTGEIDPGPHYYKRLAEARRQALDLSLVENKHLHERIEGLEVELNISRDQLAEASNLVEVLQEILKEKESEEEINAEGGVRSSDQRENYIDLQSDNILNSESILDVILDEDDILTDVNSEEE